MKALIPASRLIKRQVALLLVALAPTAFAVSEIVPTNSPVLQPWSGGVNPQPTITSLTTDRAAGTLLLKWSGVHTAPYQIEKSDVVAGGKWSKVGSPTADNSASVPTSKDGNAIFRVTAGYAQYVGQGVCRGCHPTTHGEWSKTVHAGAIGTLKAIGQGSNPACLPCHTVGYGLHGGFVSEAATPALAGVQCENCHGPGGHHVGDPGDLTVRPVISLAGMVCGGCHNGFHHPTYDNWLTAGHAIVTPDVSGGFYNTNTAAADARMRSCGACHSGAVRLAMLEGAEHTPPVQLPGMPAQDVAAKTGVTCAVCHNPHEETENTAQLRNPTHSTDFFSYSTATNVNFTTQYNEKVQMCAQCHNQRGAAWNSSGRPPHHSPQYNMLTGNVGSSNVVGSDLSSLAQSSHRDIEKQCTACHTHPTSPTTPTPSNPVYTGHGFEPLPVNCAPCHTEEEAEVFIGFRQRNTKAAIAEVKGLLDTWATSKAPDALKAKYGKLAWEYTSAGQLSQPTNAPATNVGPSSAEQAQIPDEIKKSRFLLYLVEHDGSYGVHNARFSSGMLAEAKKLVNAKLQ